MTEPAPRTKQYRKSLRRKVRREIEKLRALESHKTLGLMAHGAHAALSWILWIEDGYISPSTTIQFGIDAEKRAREKRKK
jgi:hypothetical protein